MFLRLGPRASHFPGLGYHPLENRTGQGTLKFRKKKSHNAVLNTSSVQKCGPRAWCSSLINKHWCKSIYFSGATGGKLEDKRAFQKLELVT